MSRKLWIVRMEVETVAYAESEQDAIDAIRSEPEAVAQAFDFSDALDAVELTDGDQLPDGWDVGCIPWGSGQDLTIRRILEISRKETTK